MEKKLICVVCALLACALLALPAASAEGTARALSLPVDLTMIEEEAFMDDASITSVTIPAGTQAIGARAFAGCTGLAQVVIEAGASLTIEPGAFEGCTSLAQLVVGTGATVVVSDDAFSGCGAAFDVMASAEANMVFAPEAFSGCGDITFYAHQGGSVELYALAHGYKTISLDSESALEQARSMVAAYGVAPSALQSGGTNFDSHRLIVVTNEDRLPDISAYEPIGIARSGDDTYFIQFSDEVHTADCYNALYGVVDLVEPDIVQSGNLNYYGDTPDEISAAALTDYSQWGTGDPMGFDYYSNYVQENGSGHVTIAVIDSGIVQGKGYGFERMVRKGINIASSGSADSWRNVTNYHGSIVASVISSCVGDANVDLLAIRVEEDTGAIDSVLLERAIRYAMENGADIINLSLKLEAPSQFVTRAIQAAVNQGITVVAAAGNSHVPVSQVFPANVSNVVSVAGVAPGNRLSNASGYGSGIAYAAPSEYIEHLIYKGRTSTGTSFAAPQIAAALALVRLDNNHTVSDMNATCLAIEGGGLGMPQLNQLAVVPTQWVAFGEDTPSIMAVGDTHELSWIVSPDKATDKSVTVTPSNSVIRVDAVGDGYTLNAMRTGSAVITLKANDGHSEPVSITIAVQQPVTGIELTGSTHSMWLGDDPFQLTADVTPANATNPMILWSSSNENVATVDDTGLVTPVGEGSTVIRADAEDDFGAYAEWPLTVSLYPDADQIMISDGKSTTGATICVGETLQLTAMIAPVEAEQQVLWTVVPGTGSATITQNGLLTAVSGGSVTVFAFAQSDTSLSCSFNVDIKPAPESIEIVANDGVFTMYTGSGTGFTCVVYPEEAYAPEIRWYSTDPSVVSIEEDTGWLSALTVGTAEIYATADTGVADGRAIGQGTILTSQHVAVEVLPAPQISFEANGGSVNATILQAYYGQALGTLPTPTRPNYTFTGWYTDATGGTLYTAGSICDQTENFTLYAHWALQIFTISFNANGGSVSTASKTATVNTAIGTLPTPTRDYYTFNGWYTAASGGTQVTSSTQYSEAKAVTLYAHWTQNGFGNWSDWSTTVYTANSNREVESKSFPTYTTKTVYHYKRWIWKSAYFTSYRSDAHTGTGVYQETTSDTPFTYYKTYTWNGVKHIGYSGTKIDSCTYWYDEWTTTEDVVSGSVTKYRYRDRIK